MTPTDSNASAADEPFGSFPAPVRPDPGRIFELIKARDPRHGRVTRFARWLGRNPQSLWNLRNDGKGASLEFLVQIAAALKVELKEITLAGTTAQPEEPQPEEPQPKAEAALPAPKTRAPPMEPVRRGRGRTNSRSHGNTTGKDKQHMNAPNPDVAAKIRDIQMIYGLVAAGHGLPMPFTGPDRAAFWFTTIVHAEDARSSVADAKQIFAWTFGAVFTHRDVWASNGARRMYEALLPSGLTIVLAAQSKDMQDEDDYAEDAGELVAA